MLRKRLTRRTDTDSWLTENDFEFDWFKFTKEPEHHDFADQMQKYLSFDDVLPI